MSIFITKIKLYNFRRFREFVIEPNTKNNILIGDKESGKSTILEAIDLVSGGNNRRVEAIGLDNLLNIEAVTEFINSDRCYADLPKLRVELFLLKVQLNTSCLKNFMKQSPVMFPKMMMYRF